MSARQSSARRSRAGKPTLGARRRQNRRRGLIAFGVFVLLLIIAGLIGLRQSAVRISHIAVFGADPALAATAASAMQGSYLGIIPRDSIFFFPSAKVRASILAADSDAAAVSIFRSGFTGLSIKVDERAAIARWCGLTPTPGVEPYCYAFDDSGLIYAAAASTSETVNPFTLYAPLAASSTEPLGASIKNAEDLPSIFDFARQLLTFGSPVTTIVVASNGEVSDYLASGTRITYVLGDEQNAFTALVSAQSDVHLSNGSVDYVDLRFDGKIYIKPKAATSTAQ